MHSISKTAFRPLVATRCAAIRGAVKRLSSASSQSSASATEAAPSSGKELQNEHLQEQSTVKASTSDAKDSKGDKQPKRKTMAELDEELRQKLEGCSGEGGASGLEYEDGKATAMKRGVRNNMFRLI